MPYVYRDGRRVFVRPYSRMVYDAHRERFRGLSDYQFESEVRGVEEERAMGYTPEYTDALLDEATDRAANRMERRERHPVRIPAGRHIHEFNTLPGRCVQCGMFMTEKEGGRAQMGEKETG